MLLVFGDGTQQTDLTDRGIRNAVQSLGLDGVRTVAAVKNPDEMLLVVAFDDYFNLYFIDEANEIFKALENLEDLNEVAIILTQYTRENEAWVEGFRSISHKQLEIALGANDDRIARWAYHLPFLITLAVAFRVYTPFGMGSFVDAAIEGGVAVLIGRLISSLTASLTWRLPTWLVLLAAIVASTLSVVSFLLLRDLYLTAIN